MECLPLEQRVAANYGLPILSSGDEFRLECQTVSPAQFAEPSGGAVYIPQGTCITVTNVGSNTLTDYFVFSSPASSGCCARFRRGKARLRKSSRALTVPRPSCTATYYIYVVNEGAVYNQYKWHAY